MITSTVRRVSPAVLVAFGLLLLGADALDPPAARAGGSAVARLRSADPAQRLDALNELSQLGDEQIVEQRRALRGLLKRLLAKDRRPDIRAAAAGVLARADGADAVAPLIAALRAERAPVASAGLVAAFTTVPVEDARKALSSVAFDASDVRTAALAAEALGRLPGYAGRDDLMGLLIAAPHWAVAAGACRGLSGHRHADVPGVLVKRLRHPDAAVRAAARWSLATLCGLDHGVDPAVWERWWAKEGAEFRFPDPREPAPAPVKPSVKPPVVPAVRDGTTRDATGLGRPTFARFFGIELRGQRVAFVIDFSQSMWGPRRNKAQAELIRAVKGLSGEHRFSVILFNEKVWSFADGPLPALPQQKLDLTRYLPDQETKSYTNIYDAMERALGLLGVGSQAVRPAPGLDEIVLLSDGVPNRGKLKRTDQILEAVKLLNGGRARIHTVSLGDEPIDLLPRMAEENGGRHVSHPFPK